MPGTDQVGRSFGGRRYVDGTALRRRPGALRATAGGQSWIGTRAGARSFCRGESYSEIRPAFVGVNPQASK
jgi:hypothetical protein